MRGAVRFKFSRRSVAQFRVARGDQHGNTFFTELAANSTQFPLLAPVIRAICLCDFVWPGSAYLYTDKKAKGDRTIQKNIGIFIIA